MSMYGLELSCLLCGQPVRGVTEGKPIAGREARAVCKCVSCGREWLLTATMTEVVGDALEGRQKPQARGPRPVLEGVPHGFRKSYIRGCRCGACTQAEADYHRAWRAS